MAVGTLLPQDSPYYSSVVRITIIKENVLYTATGMIMSGGRHILTSAHVIGLQSSEWASIVVYHPSTNASYAVSAVQAHPEYVEAIRGKCIALYVYADIAVLTLHIPISRAHGLPLYRELNEIGKSFTRLGGIYSGTAGSTQTEVRFSTNRVEYFNTGTNSMYLTDGTALVSDSDDGTTDGNSLARFFGYTSDVDSDNYEDMGIPGWSGGGLLIGGKIAGLTSMIVYQPLPNGQGYLYIVGLDIRISRVVNWVDSVSGAAHREYGNYNAYLRLGSSKIANMGSKGHTIGGGVCYLSSDSFGQVNTLTFCVTTYASVNMLSDSIMRELSTPGLRDSTNIVYMESTSYSREGKEVSGFLAISYDVAVVVDSVSTTGLLRYLSRYYSVFGQGSLIFTHQKNAGSIGVAPVFSSKSHMGIQFIGVGTSRIISIQKYWAAYYAVLRMGSISGMSRYSGSATSVGGGFLYVGSFSTAEMIGNNTPSPSNLMATVYMQQSKSITMSAVSIGVQYSAVVSGLSCNILMSESSNINIAVLLGLSAQVRMRKSIAYFSEFRPDPCVLGLACTVGIRTDLPFAGTEGIRTYLGVFKFRSIMVLNNPWVSINSMRLSCSAMWDTSEMALTSKNLIKNLRISATWKATQDIKIRMILPGLSLVTSVDMPVRENIYFSTEIPIFSVHCTFSEEG